MRIDHRNPLTASDRLPVGKWVKIGSRTVGGKWLSERGSMISIPGARAEVNAGRCTMAHRRGDGGFDLLVWRFREPQPPQAFFTVGAA